MTGPSSTEHRLGPGTPVVARAPGRVNLIGDHTDYTGGWCLPVAIDLETTARFEPGTGATTLSVSSDAGTGQARLEVPVEPDPVSLARIEPTWARYVAATAALLAPRASGTLELRTTLPVGAGLSSSAALEVATALALGFSGPPLELAQRCRRAEQLASGVPCGIMDQLVVVAAIAQHALLIECATPTWRPVRLPDDIQILVADSGRSRPLATSPYASRRDQCSRAEQVIGPLCDATLSDAGQLADPVLWRRARHVITENARVLEAVAALEAGDVGRVGKLMDESHASLADDFEVSTPELDALSSALRAIPGVWGARLTGAGFGGCVVALADLGARVPDRLASRVFRVRASPGASVTPA